MSSAPQPPPADGAVRAARRTFSAADYPLGRVARLKRETVTAILPAREVAATLGTTLERLAPLCEAGVLDELVVVDSASRDGTAAIAARHGAAVLQQDELLPELGPALGKGDAMWRALAATGGEVVVFLDADSEDFDAAFALGLIGPLLERRELQYVKGAYRRPFRSATGELSAEGGGRVNELVARPLLNLFAPDLAGFAQPLAGEVAARRALVEQLPFPVGYGVEVAMLLDTLRVAGLAAMAQSDLGSRQNAHQPLRELSAMAYAVLATASRRIFGKAAVPTDAGELLLPLAAVGELERRTVRLEERPPLRDLKR